MSTEQQVQLALRRRLDHCDRLPDGWVPTWSSVSSQLTMLRIFIIAVLTYPAI